MAHLFDRFPARYYLEKYYSEIGPENDAFMRATATAVDRLDDLGTVIELGGGPSLCGLLAMTAATDRGPRRVAWLDASPGSLDEVASWLADAPSAFDYGAVRRWIAGTLGADPDAVARRLRDATWDLRRVDLQRELPTDLTGVGDVVGSYFFAEAATGHEREFVKLTAGVSQVAATGAHVALAYIRHSQSYRLDDDTVYPAYSLDEETLPQLLDAAGLRFDELVVSQGPLDDPPARPGYDGMVFAHGRLARGAQTAHGSTGTNR